MNIKLTDAEAQDLARELIWRLIPFEVSYNLLSTKDGKGVIFISKDKGFSIFWEKNKSRFEG